MGVSHLSPTSTRQPWQSIIVSKGNHVSIDPEEESHTLKWKRERIRNRFTEDYGFTETSEWLTASEKVIAETRHGVELRELHHPSGTTIYYYIVVVDGGEFNQSNLGVRHAQTYYETLKTELHRTFGNLRRKTSAWTSEEIQP